MICRALKDTKEEQINKNPEPTIRSTTLKNSSNLLKPYSDFNSEPKVQVSDTSKTDGDSSNKSLPRKFTTSPHRKSWTLLDTDMVKVKGIY